MKDILSDLNEKQKEAVTTTEGYVRVVAGAGSGKTKALTHRFAFLVETLGVPTDNILCVTFTNKAAGEMRNRIRKLIGDHDTGYICTFHGFCVKELREDIHVFHYPKNFIILDEDDQKVILRNVYSDRGIDTKRYPISLAIDLISSRKNTLEYINYLNQINNDQLLKKYAKAGKPEDIIFYGYLCEQKKNYSLDYDDLINFTFYILSNYEDIRTSWQKRMQYIMVDEFQDVSKRQYMIADLLSDYHKNLFVVGDPDQTIYSWRGADVNYFMDFETVHANTKTIIMDINYRSNSPIILGSNSLIEKNKNRIKKDLKPVKNNGELIHFYHGKNVKAEAEWIADKIKHLCSNESISTSAKSQNRKYQYEDIALLYRVHHVSRAIEEVFIQHKIPYVIYSGVEFYGRKEIKDVLAYLRMIMCQDNVSFERVINEPRRNFGKKRMDIIKTYARENDISLYDSLKMNLNNELIQKSQAIEFVSLVENYKTSYSDYRITDLLERILNITKYEEKLKSAGEDERLDNLAELKQSIADYENNSKENTSLEEYLQNVSLFTNMDKEQRKKSVKLMTIHASKGLEFPVVFLCGASEGIFPNSRVTGYDEIEEERRLAYVACTRAEDRLFISDAEGLTFDGEGRCPSRFVFDIDEKYLRYINPIDENQKQTYKKRFTNDEPRQDKAKASKEIVPGMRIKHEFFGKGTVLNVDDIKKCYEIKFDNAVTSRNIMKTVKLEII